jgi:hypothetical protein
MQNKIKIIKPKHFSKKRTFCCLCETVLRNVLDFESSDKYGCCEECRLKWVEARREEYLAGWRPDKESIIEEIEKRKSIPLSFVV